LNIALNRSQNLAQEEPGAPGSGNIVEVSASDPDMPPEATGMNNCRLEIRESAKTEGSKLK
jgi:hypothetical protein